MRESSALRGVLVDLAKGEARPDARPSSRRALIAGIVRHLQEILQEIDCYSRWSLRRFGVTGPQALAMRLIRRRKSITTGDLADRMFLHISTVSSLVDRLERRRLVNRVRDGSDRRHVWLRLTPRGRETVGLTPPPPRSRLPEGLGDLSRNGLMEIRRSLGHLDSILHGRALNRVRRRP